MNITLQQLKKKEAELRKELEDVAAAVRVIERLGGGNHATASLMDSDAPDLGDSGAINLDDLLIPKKTKSGKVTLLNDAKAVIDRFGTQEFTTSQLFAALNQTGKGKDVNSKNFKNRVSMIVRKLAAEGFLQCTYKGKGNAPHLYKRASGQVSLVSKNVS